MKTIGEVFIFCLREATAVLAKGLVGYVNYNSQAEIDKIGSGPGVQNKQK